jgi:hypothetical protein
MALESKRHAIGHPQGAENSPPGEQTHLARSQHRLGSSANTVIVKNKTVEHHTILSCRGKRLAFGVMTAPRAFRMAMPCRSRSADARLSNGARQSKST